MVTPGNLASTNEPLAPNWRDMVLVIQKAHPHLDNHPITHFGPKGQVRVAPAVFNTQ